MWSNFILSPSFKVKFKRANYSFIIDPRCLQCETSLWEIVVWESFDVVPFDLGPLIQSQMTAKLKNAYNFRNLQPLHFCYVRGYTAGSQ